MAGAPSTWTFNLSDTDTVFDYQPYADGPFVNGWQAGWSNLGVSPPDAEHNDGSGTSYHVTSFPQANVSLTFFGTGVSLLGETNCTYDITLDGSPVSAGIPPSGTLYSGSNLDNTVHEIVLLPQPTSGDQTLNFTGAQLVSPASSSPIPERIDNQNTSVIAYSGPWTQKMAHQIPNSQSPSPYFQTNASGSSASLNFTGRAVAVRGESNFGWWTYSANLDGQTYNMNASSVFIIPDAVLFYRDGLDENITHSLTLTNTAEDSFNFALNSITAYHLDSSVSEPASSSSSPTVPSNSSLSSSDSGLSHSVSGGTIAGIVIGVIAGIAIVAFLLLWLCRRRREILSQDPNRQTEAFIEPFNPPNMSEDPRGSTAASVTIAPIIATKAGAMLPRVPQENHSSSSVRIADDVKRRPLPSALVSVPQPQVPPSINPPSTSTARPSESGDHESVERLANAVVERLALRFGSGDHNSEASPPSYSQ